MMDLPQGFWLDTVDSTQDEAKRLIQAGRIQGTAYVVASHQTAGRGTQGRAWASPDNAGIYLSVVHRPLDKPGFEVSPLYTLAAGVACVEALALVTGISAQLKPINDIYVNGCKLGGILVESELQQSQGLTAIITGIGINTHHIARDFDRAVHQAISLEELLGPEAFCRFSTEALVETLVAKICFWYALLFQGQEGQVLRAWNSHRLPGAIGPASSLSERLGI